jgi:hypothetical protein
MESKKMPVVENAGDSKIIFPGIFNFLFENHKYKVAYGGRGSAKSHSFARAAIVHAMQKNHRILCGREYQNSISDSVHQLLSDVIYKYKLQKYFNIKEKEIECRKTGSLFKFKGLHHNIDEIKSFEGVTICWVEEAANVSEESWKLLLPTIFRTEGAQLWVGFNTGYDDDSTFERFVKSPPEGCKTVLVNYYDNDFFPKELDEIRQWDYKHRRHEYDNIWLGKPKGYGGKVWPQFIDKKFPSGHIREFDWNTIEETANVICAMDPAQKYYPACVWIAIFPANKRAVYPDDFFFWIYAEYPTFDDFGDYFYKFRKTTLYPHTLKVLSNTILSKDSSGHRLKCSKRFIDTRFATGTGSGNIWSNETTGLIEQLAKPENNSLIFELPSIKFIDSAKNDIVQLMQFNPESDITIYNSPKFFISPWCKNTRYSLANHRVEEESEKEAEKLKDFSDVVRIAFAGLKEFRYKNPMGASQNKAGKIFEYSNSNESWMG